MTVSFKNRPLPVTIKLPELGILNFINQYGNLWIGNISKEYYHSEFLIRKKHLIDTIVTLHDQTDRRLVDANFRLSLLRAALKESWRHPAFAYYKESMLTGNSRLFAGGLASSDPWINFKVMVFAPCNIIPDQILNPEKITSDEQLWEVLGIDQLGRDSYMELLLDFKPNVSRGIDLELVFNNRHTYQKSQIDQNIDLVKKFQAWQIQYPRPTIGIYTDWPELIDNSNDHWNITILGPSRDFKQRIINPANFEKVAFLEHADQNHKNFDHIMWIIKSRKINLDELLFWVDLDHTTFIDHNWDFIVYRRNITYNSTYVSLSYF